MNSPRPISSAARGGIGMALVGGSVAVSRTLGAAPLFTVQAVRYALAAVLLVGLARGTGVALRRPRGRDWLWLIGVAVSGLVVFNVAVVRGTAHAEPAVIAVAVACVPVLLGVVGPLLEGQRPRWTILVAAVVVTVGGALAAGTGRTDGVGVLWAAVALACEAGFTLLAVPVLGRLGPWGVSVHSVWIGAVIFAVLGLAFEPTDAALHLAGHDWAAIGYLAAAVTAAAFVLWYSAVAALGAARAGLLTGIAPISAATSGMLTGAGRPEWPVWVAIAVVVAGLVAGLASSRGPTGACSDPATVTVVGCIRSP